MMVDPRDLLGNEAGWPMRSHAQRVADLEALPVGAVPNPRVYGVGGPVLVWVHGGGFVAGDLDMPEAHDFAQALAATGICVLTVDYRKALHGVRFPAPLDDVAEAWRLARERWPDTELHLGGASAGGALAAGLALRLRDGLEPAPASIVLAYPTLHSDLPADGEVLAAMTDVPEHRRFRPDRVRAMHENDAGDSVDDPHATPGVDTGAGLAPLLIISSEFDDLRASGAAFARAVADAGGRVEHVVEPATFHGYLNEPDGLGFAAGVRRISEWIGGTNPASPRRAASSP